LSSRPLHLPTVLEDDVFLYDYDYCYRPHGGGDSFAADLIVRFLDDWLLQQQWPAVVNLHPEHVDPTHNAVMNAVLSWASAAGVWMPTLDTFIAWIEARSRCHIDVIDRATVRVSAPQPLVLRASRGLIASGESLALDTQRDGHVVLGGDQQCPL
jgi:hypothetical protein